MSVCIERPPRGEASFCLFCWVWLTFESSVYVCVMEMPSILPPNKGFTLYSQSNLSTLKSNGRLCWWVGERGEGCKHVLVYNSVSRIISLVNHFLGIGVAAVKRA